MLDFNGALSQSMKQFRDVVEPKLTPVLGGEFRIVEGITIDEVARLLDTMAGIDAWHIDRVCGIRGLASRIQTVTKNWHTFTIRKNRQSGAKTEYEKRKEAIEKGYLYPFFTMQAYISIKDNNLISFAVARTKDIIEMIDLGHYTIKQTGRDQKGQAQFYVVDWYAMQKCHYPIRIRSFTHKPSISGYDQAGLRPSI